MTGAVECLKIPEGLCPTETCQPHADDIAHNMSGATHLPREGDGTGQYSASSFQAAKTGFKGVGPVHQHSPSLLSPRMDRESSHFPRSLLFLVYHIS